MEIAPALNKALSENLDFTGAIAFHRAYPDAPNPNFEILGLGPIGLPLNPREAQLIKSRAEQASFGKREGMIADISARDTWKVDAEKV
ncbi:hypothetical protein EIP86_000358 [Pleurotus ostreatoroseus]|nr:hypothetical protein EIP86_000358 [Pleurotus ostreatoroseus]